ncbi:MAG: hypothetical protein A3B13_03620 [Candidatus Liptonbacteria bacterium RIFCSPLOWO2_01_FULL_45_15]|uniref:Uncharacterized protein n=1 Tax=Candidatus Liptonbacteria bacterium RIFCSPLOWO2_01_FULL_45_15 TaxID=1798649 RepID=A0A1G2CKB5_9BACT|nr:MAG: hypothetical protein A3B13_03620 [Candidatus Liptonbacteria bacterium RIFCSPLOWO2_01_FULL_45_15]
MGDVIKVDFGGDKKDDDNAKDSPNKRDLIQRKMENEPGILFGAYRYSSQTRYFVINTKQLRVLKTTFLGPVNNY